MNAKNTLSVSEARKIIFKIVDDVQKSTEYYTLTERGVPRAVVLSAEKFEYLAEERAREISKAVFGASGMKPGDGNLIYEKATRNYIARNPQVFPKIFIIRDESKIVYLSRDEEEARRKEDSLTKARLYIKLIEKLKYPIELIELCRYVKVGGEDSKRYIEADIIVNDINGNTDMILETYPFDTYEENMDKAVADLFDLSATLSFVKKPKLLVYYSCIFKQQELQEKITVIDTGKFNTFFAWKKAGRIVDKKIPGFSQEKNICY